MVEGEQRETGPGGTGSGGEYERVSRVAAFVSVALLACALTAGLVGTVAAQTTTAPDCTNVGYTTDGSGNYEVTNVSQLQCVGNASTSTSLTDSFVLTQDIDASGTSSWNGGAGFKPIAEDTDGSTTGFQGDPFEGTFDGQNNEIKGLFIDRQNQDFVGLFGRIGPPSGEVRDLGVVGADITGRNDVGVLVGENADSITGSYSTGSVSTNPNDIYNYAGGLVGTNQGTITESYSTASASASNYAGGLAGLITNAATVEDSYATGKVSADNFFAGGLGGDNRGSITRTYATGAVSAGSGSSGGLLGDNDGTVSGSYWDVETTGQSGSAGSATGLMTSEMKGDPAKTNMSAFDFTNTWDVVDNSSYLSYPFLRNNQQEPAPGLTTKNSAPTADAGGPYTVNEGDSVTLDGTGSSDPDGDSLTYSWDLDNDGSFEVSDDPTPVFDASSIDGTTSRTVTLRVDDGSGGTDTDSATVNVENVAPTVTIDFLPGTVDEGDTVALDASFSDVDVDTHTATVDWGDGTTESVSVDQTNDTLSSSHTYEDDGSYTVTVTVTDDDGDSGSESQTVDVANVAPDVTIDSLPGSADEGDTVTLDASFDDPGTDDTHTATVDWGDGTTESVSVDQASNTLSSSHTYEDDGSYTVTVTVEDDDGGTGTDSDVVNVENVAPTVSIDSLPGSADEGESVSLDASFTDPGTDDTHTATVDWGDGTTESVSVDQASNTLSATHTYADDGSYAVTVTVTDDDGGTGSDSATVNVENVPPDVTIDSLPGSANEGDTVALDASFSDPGNDTHNSTVDWGDGTTESVPVDQTNDTLSSSHMYDDNDSYTVNVTVEDDDGGSGSDSASITVSNVAPSVTIDSLPDTADEGDTVALDASFSDPGSGDTHTATVDWGDGTTEPVGVDQTNDTLSTTHTYYVDVEVSYTVTVTVEDDDGGTGAANDTVRVDELCINRREVSRGQEDEECPRDRTIRRGGSRENLDRETDRRGDTRRRDRSRRDRGR